MLTLMRCSKRSSDSEARRFVFIILILLCALSKMLLLPACGNDPENFE